MSQAAAQSIKVIPRMMGDQHDFIDQMLSFVIFVMNDGSQPVTINEIGLMQKKKKKMPLKAPMLNGIKGFPAVLPPQGQFSAIFHPDSTGKNVYTSAYVETDDGTVIEGKSYDLTLLSEG